MCVSVCARACGWESVCVGVREGVCVCQDVCMWCAREGNNENNTTEFYYYYYHYYYYTLSSGDMRAQILTCLTTPQNRSSHATAAWNTHTHMHIYETHTHTCTYTHAQTRVKYTHNLLFSLSLSLSLSLSRSLSFSLLSPLSGAHFSKHRSFKSV